MIYNETKFKVEKVNVNVEEGIESVWVIMTTRVLDHKLQKIKIICVGSVYIAPRSEMKSETKYHESTHRYPVFGLFCTLKISVISQKSCLTIPQKMPDVSKKGALQSPKSCMTIVQLTFLIL